MARASKPATPPTTTPREVVEDIIDDYVSQTDTSDQDLESDLEVVAGKELRADTISETTGAAGVTIDSLNLKDGNVELGTGHVNRTCSAETLGAGVTTFAVTGDVMVITGDAGANTIATITGGGTGQELTLIFVDGNVTITDTDAHTANTVDLSAAFTSADDTVLKLIFDGTSWYEVSRSVN